MEASLAPTNPFLGVRQAHTRPYKSIFRGEAGPHPPLQIFFQFIMKNYLIQK